MARQPLVGARPPLLREFMITLRHTTLGRTPVDEFSARHRNLYLKTHNTDKRQIHAPRRYSNELVPDNERK
jgi:hypothetical protein